MCIDYVCSWKWSVLLYRAQYTYNCGVWTHISIKWAFRSQEHSLTTNIKCCKVVHTLPNVWARLRNIYSNLSWVCKVQHNFQAPRVHFLKVLSPCTHYTMCNMPLNLCPTLFHGIYISVMCSTSILCAIKGMRWSVSRGFIKNKFILII